MSQTVKNWTKLGSTLLQKTLMFDLYANRMRAPHTAHEDDYFVLKTNDWTNIIPLTDDGHVILVTQFRHGVEQDSLEIPGGIIDAGETDPQSAAIRELREETGYTAREVRPLGAMHPNPALQNNRCHSYLALGATLSGDQQLDQGEIINVHRIPLGEIPELIRSGKITHANILTTFLLFLLQHGRELGCERWLK